MNWVEQFERAEEGQADFTEIMQKLIYRNNETLFDKLNFEDDRIFQEPFLFAIVNDPSCKISLEQILYGYLTPEKRPRQLTVYADENGVVYLPQIGYYTAAVTDAFFLLDTSNSEAILTHAGTILEYTFIEAVSVNEGRIEMLLFNHSMFNSYFTGHFKSSSHEKRNIGAVWDPHVSSTLIDKAMTIIKKHLPGNYQEVNLVAKKMLLFDDSELVSFATIKAHGTAFIRNSTVDNEIYFIAEIIHQYAHCFLNAILAEKSRFFKIDSDLPMSQFNGNLSERRSIISAFHGLFTTTKIAVAFEKLYHDRVFEGTKHFEILARLVDNYRRLNTGLQRVNLDEVFTNDGKRLFNFLYGICNDVYQRNVAEVEKYSTKNQEFEFSFKKFLDLNPYQPI